MTSQQSTLSERLFSPVQHAPETSTITFAGRRPNPFQPPAPYVDGADLPGFYRLQKRAFWHWQGIDSIEIEATLARMAAAPGPRSVDDWIDTVAEYRPGNWVFEWSRLGAEAQQKAQQATRDEDASVQFLAAARYFALASYPHLKGDRLALQAQLLANQAYREAGRRLPVPLKELRIPFNGKEVQGYLHLPATDRPLPLVIVSGSLDSLQLDFWHFYRRFLAPAGIAMLTVDMPGVGYSAHWPLVQDSSRLHQAVLHHVPSIPWVDERRVAMLGVRMGGNVAARLASLEPFRLRAVVTIAGAANLFFTERERFMRAPAMLRDCIANRLGMKSNDWEGVYQHCRGLSLKTQGLLGRKTPVPLLSIGHRHDFLCPEPEIQALAATSRGGEALVLDKLPLLQVYETSLARTRDWLLAHL
ncbi:esterase FrsA [Oceanimonas pelagia]|uniref:Esterase FrsA n=1 Tax=Oceanimonas pelagia TaxID=3028314 RepID=A0AA50QB34_9GAMM|nr:esterase FrsA [Oceanimonas pelagia]WMC09744.1 esterase FrsA [Oceanimonas pelagia]